MSKLLLDIMWLIGTLWTWADRPGRARVCENPWQMSFLNVSSLFSLFLSRTTTFLTQSAPVLFFPPPRRDLVAMTTRRHVTPQLAATPNADHVQRASNVDALRHSDKMVASGSICV